MNKKFLIICSFFLVIFFFNSALINSQSVCDWRGYIIKDGSLANSSYVVTSYTNGSQATNGTIYDSGYYILPVLGSDENNNITFKVCGVYVQEAPQTWSCGSPGYHKLNLTMNATADGTSCTYNCGCTANYCYGGVCGTTTTTTPATTTAPGGGGGGGGGGGVTTTTTTTTKPVTTVPGITTTTPGVTTKPKPVTTIPPSVTTKPKRVPLGVELSTLQIAGIIVGVVVILALIIFLFVRFQAVKMAT